MNWFDLSTYSQRNKILWWSVLGIGALATLYSLTQLHTLTHTQLWQFVCFLFVIIFAGRLTIATPSNAGTLSPTDALIFLAMFFLGTPAATIGAALNGYIATTATNRNKPERLYGASNQAFATWIAGTLLYQTVHYQCTVAWRDFSAAEVQWDLFFVAAVAMSAVYFLSGSFTTAIFQASQRQLNLFAFWWQHHLWSGLYVFATGFVSLFIYILIQVYSPLCLLLLLPVVAVSFIACRNYWAKVESVSQDLAEVSRLHFATVEALATAIDAKDQVTHEHVRRVQIYAEEMGRIFKLSADEIEALRAGALLHDIGKLAVPDHLLNKPGKLTPAEFEKMKVHTTVGARILERVNFPYPVVPIVRYHHERWDGKGYPEGLRGDTIPLTARILSVVDCFDAVREPRAYRRAISRTDACQLLLTQSGKHFDPQVVTTFLENLPIFEARIQAAGIALQSSEEDALGLFVPASDESESSTVSTQPEFWGQIAAAHHEVASLYEIARTFSTSLDLEDTLSIFVNKLKPIIPFDTCAIYLFDDEKQCATAQYAVGQFADCFKGQEIFPGDGVIGWVLAHRKTFCNADPALDFAALQIPSEDFRTSAVAPLLKGELMIGVIALYAAQIERYTNDHLRVLETISTLAADSIYNALDHAETREFALTDALTGMPNARSLHFQFAQESNRANRLGSPLSVLMMDLDGFKKINDTYGHHAGNEFLIGIGNVISGELRSYDYLARYAGDEFVALLPGTTQQDLDDLMWRIQRAVENYKLPVRDGSNVKAGVSLGAARYGLEANSLERLLRIADRRMYKNKQLRRQHEFLMEAGEAGDAIAQAIDRN